MEETKLVEKKKVVWVVLYLDAYNELQTKMFTRRPPIIDMEDGCLIDYQEVELTYFEKEKKEVK